MADVITRLKLDSGEYDSKIKRATQGLLQMEQECRKVGGTLAILEKDQLEFVKGLGHMETVSKSARGKLSELTQAYTELSMQYKRLTDEEKKGDFGKALSSSLDQLKGRINATQKQLADVNKELGTASKEGMDFSSVLNALGGQLGINTQLMTAVTGGTMGYVAAIVGVSTAVLAATKALIDYNTEMQRQNNVTSVVTGLSGTDAEELTAGIKALSDTYNVDFREAVEAANTLIHQFGLSGKEALDLLQDGMQGMIQGDGGKLLQMIQQYAPSFRDAGISASQLVAIIHNSEGGLFTDQNMNAIVMGIKNIRLMTKQTSDALNQLGIDGDEMSKKLDDGSMTVFDALRQVADKIDEVGSGSKAAGEVMQAVFGRQGTMAGTKLGEAIATLNLNLEETRTQTGELGASFVDLQDANRRLDTAMQGLLGNTVGWDEMNNTIKSGLLNSLAAVIEDVNTLKTAIDGLDASSDSFKNLADAIDNTLISKLSTAVFLASQLRKLIQEMKGESGGQNGKSSGGGKGKGSSTPKDGTYWEKTDASGNIIAAGIYKGGKQYQTTGPEVVVTPDTKPTKNKPKSGRTSVKKNTPKWSSIEVGEMAGLDVATLGRSYSDINKDMSAAKKQYEEAGDMFARAAAAKLIEELGIEKTTMQAMEDPMAEANKHNFQKDLDAYNKGRDKNEKKDKKEVSLAKEVGNMVGGIDQMVGGLESLGVEIPKGLKDVVGGIQAMITIVTGISSVVTAIAAIAAADALKPLAGGGIVPHAALGRYIPGNSYSGDNVFGGNAWVNSGELVLNKAQQGVLASELQGGGMGNMHLETYVDGRDLRIVLNNDTMSHGKGKYVISKTGRA